MNTKLGLAFIKTHHSFRHGTGFVSDYIAKAATTNTKSLALIDVNSLADMVTFYDKCQKNDIDPILGATLSIYDRDWIYQTSRRKNSELVKLLDRLLSNEEQESFFIELFNKRTQFIKEKKRAGRAKRFIDALIEAVKSRENKVLISALRALKKNPDPLTLCLKQTSKLKPEEQKQVAALSRNLTDEQRSLLALECDKFKIFEDSDFPFLTIIASDNEGFRNVKKIISSAHIHGQKKELLEVNTREQYAKTELEYLSLKTQGVYCILGFEGDIIASTITSEGVNRHSIDVIKKLKEVFCDRLVIGIERSTSSSDSSSRRVREINLNEALLDLAEQENIPCFALNHARFVERDHIEAHQTKEAILLDDSPNNINFESNATSGQFLEGWSDFSKRYDDCHQLIKNGEKLWHSIKQKEESHGVDIQLDTPILPAFPIPDGHDEVSYMRTLAERGIAEHLSNKHKKQFGTANLENLTDEQRLIVKQDKTIYQERLDFEIEIIHGMGFVGYFLIVSDFIIWAKENGVPVGDGRGSGAGSIVAYGLKITNIDPIRHSLLFERFLNPERVSMPDFDIDFGSGYHPVTGESVGRDDVIQYVADKYNDPNAEFASVAQIATHGLMLGKSATKFVAKTMGLSLRFAEDLTSEYPEAPDTKLAESLLVPAVKYKHENEPTTAKLLNLAVLTEGLKKSSGVHAGGVVIADGDITKFVSVQSPKSDPLKLITQTDKGDVERAGLVKFDFLGLSNLTTISLCIHYIFRTTGVKIDLNDIHIDDEATYKLLQEANVQGVFQVESAGMKELLRKVKVENIEDYSALLALYRPGPLGSGMVDNFIARKHGVEEISYPDAKYQHECLKDILEPTYGIILYQEQVMQIAQAMAGYSLGGADLLRRAMGKKKPEEMEKQRATFEKGATENDIDSKLSMKIFDLVEKFAGYGFNKSHSMSYAYISFYTAWLKAHYPTEYMAAVLTGIGGDHDALEVALEDCHKNGITILPPDINKSDSKFIPEGDSCIRYGLAAIHEVGESKLKSILLERESNGDFKNSYDLKLRCGSSFDATISRALAESGALDTLNTYFETPIDSEQEVSRESNIKPKPKLDRKHVVAIAEKTAELNEAERRLESVTGYGKGVSTVINSLCLHYNKKYALNIDLNLPQKAKVGKLWAFFGIQLSKDQNPNREAIEADFNVLQRELEARNLGGEVYMQYIDSIKQLRSELESLKTQRKSPEIHLQRNQEFEAHFWKRRYHLHETRMLSSITSVQLKKGEKEVVYLSLGDLTEQLEEEIQPLISMLTEGDDLPNSLNELGAFIDQHIYANNLILATSTIEAIHDRFESFIGEKRTRPAINKLRNDLHALIKTDEEILAKYGNLSLKEHAKELPAMERLKAEQSRMALYTTGHPIDVNGTRAQLTEWFDYVNIGDLSPATIDKITESPLRESTYVTGGIVKSIREMTVKKDGKLFGRKMAAFILDDGTGSIRATAFPDTYDQIKDNLYKGALLWIKGNVAIDDYLSDGTLKIELDQVGKATQEDPFFINERSYWKSKHAKDQETIGALAKKLKGEARASLIVLR